jgi:hypothetical protein
MTYRFRRQNRDKYFRAPSYILIHKMRGKILILALLLSSSFAFGTTRFVSQTAGTFSGGTACNGHITITVATFNKTTLSPGDMTYLCGTITGTAGASGLSIGQSGTNGNLISVIFDTGADLISPYWGTGAAISISGRSYILIDGGGAGGTNGIIEDTQNGSGLTYQQDSTAILGPCTPGCEIKNLLVRNLYVHSNSSDTHDFNADGFYYSNGSSQGISIHDNVAHDIHWIISLLNFGTKDSGLNIYNNNFYNMDHGIAIGAETAGVTWSNIQIHDNHIGSTNVWDTAADAYHHDGIHFYPYCDGSATCPSTFLSGYVYNNLFDGNWGVNNTAQFFCEATENNLWIFNNVFNNNAEGVNLNNGATECGGPGARTFNNTFLASSSQTTAMFAQGCGSVGACGANTMQAKNNAIANSGGIIFVPPDEALSSGGLDFNVYGNCTGSNCFIYHGNTWNSGQFSSYQSDLKTDSGSEQNSHLSVIGLNSSGVPQSGSVVIGGGTNLTSLCSGVLVALCSDTSAGNTRTPVARPSTGAWDVGAYEYSSGLQIAAPSNLKGIVH